MASWDCIVIGSGNAGCCAAFSAAESGCDKGARCPFWARQQTNSSDKFSLSMSCPREWAGGNGYYTAGAYRTVHSGLQDLLPIVNNVSKEQAESIDMDEYSHEDFLGDIMRVGEGKPDPVLASAVVNASRETIAWLADRVGIPFMLSFHRQAYAVGARQTFWGGLVLCTEDGGKGLIAAHLRAIEKAGVEVWYNCPAVEITMEDGAVNGVVVEKDGERVHLRAAAVVLAAGGFEANPAMREEKLGPGWGRAIVSRAHLTTDMSLLFVPCRGDADAPTEAGDRVLTNQFTKSGYPLGIMVNSAGKRFVDEGEDYRNYTYAKFGKAILKQPGGFAFQIWDSKVIGSLRVEEYGDGIVKKIHADSIEELAEKLTERGLEDKEELVRVVHEYNQAVKQHEGENPDKTWNPAVKDGMSTKSLSLPKSNWALTIEEPPFMAVKVACGVTFTFGGVDLDPETAGVISDKTSKAIPGLYAAGEINYPGGSGLMAGAVFGRKAGRAAASIRETSTGLKQ
ncbi:hypothetical protein FB45DRAFT_897309 [Roridomyces roridus]|uniref:FAD-dependent oxidoreductase 2 FAD-binding domain-containing protein n=1 Tax=Roridomyces roridus TaxID=1738132 RepID=A0AAD7FX82_9AGAR|nr:hypothetical protein FB45DRAFT_897309 [Roridomyces roridus]